MKDRFKASFARVKNMFTKKNIRKTITKCFVGAWGIALLGAVSFGNLSQPVKGWNLDYGYNNFGAYTINSGGVLITAQRSGNTVKYSFETHVAYTPNWGNYGFSVKLIKDDGSVPYINGNYHTSADSTVRAQNPIISSGYTHSFPGQGTGVYRIYYITGSWTENASPGAFTQKFHIYVGALANVVTSSTYGWNGGGTFNVSGAGLTTTMQDRQFSIQVPAASYSVAYDANGGSGTMASGTVTYNQSFQTAQNTFTKDGYIFAGWNEKADGTGTWWNAPGFTNGVKDSSSTGSDGVYESGKSWTWTYSSNITLYAQWVRDEVTLSYNGNGGTPSVSSEQAVIGSTITATATRAGYSFDGWYSEQTDGTKVTVVPDSDTTLYAHWIPNTYSMIYNSNGGTGTMSNGSPKYNSSFTIAANAFTRPGYTFDSWNTAAAGTGTKYTAGQIITYTTAGNTTLYAQWKANTYNIVFNGNGGTGTKTQQSATYNANVTLSKNTTISKIGYLFSGWNTEAAGTGTAYADGATFQYTTVGNLTLYAQWKPIEYTIVYDSNGGNGTVASINAKYDTYPTLSSGSGLSRNGFQFVGWSFSKNGESKIYAAGKSTGENLTDTNAATVRLYAQWKQVYSKEICGLNPGMTPQEFEYVDNSYDSDAYTAADKNLNSAVDNLMSEGMYRQGYTFTGWNTKADGSGTTYKDKAQFINKSSKNGDVIKLYAQWKKGTFEITYDLNGGTGTLASDKDSSGKALNTITNNKQTVTYGTASYISNGTGISRPGYTLIGWETVPVSNKDTVVKYNLGEKVSCLTGANLRAVWKANEVTITYYINGGVGALWTTGATPNLSNLTGGRAIQEGTTETVFTLSNGKAWYKNASAVSYWSTSPVDGQGTIYPTSFVYDGDQSLSLWAHYDDDPTLPGYNVVFNENIPAEASSTKTGDKPKTLEDCEMNVNYTIPGQNTLALTGWHTDGYWYAGKDGTGTRFAFNGVYKNITTSGTTKDLYLNWIPNTYNVTFNSNKPSNASHEVTGSVTGYDLNGGEMTNKSQYRYDSTYTLPANYFALTGWTFEGWNTKADGSGTAYKNQQSVKNLTSTDNGNVTLYAQWKPITYYVRYNANGGEGASTKQLMTYDSTQTLAACTYTRVGYHIDSTKTWNTEPKMTGTYYADKQSGKFNFKDKQDAVQDLYVNWIENTYTITYHKNDGTTDKTVKGPYNYTASVTIIDSPFTVAGHEFTYWSTKADGTGTRYDAGYAYTKLVSTNGGNIDLYANWKAQKYDLTINLKDSCYYGSSTPTYRGATDNVYIADGLEYGKGTNNAIGIAQNKGYILTGYKLNGDESTVVYDASGNATTGGNYWSANGSSAVYKGVTDLNVVAHWTPISYTIEYDPNGGTGTIASRNCKYDYTYTLSSGGEFAKTGYHIVGWSTDSSTTYKDFDSTSAEDYTLGQANIKNLTAKDGTIITMYAVWQPNKYTVQFNANLTNALGTTSSQTFTYDVAQKLNKNQYYKSGYMFIGWNTKADGTGTKINESNANNKLYADEERVINLTTINNKTIQLYAQWVSTNYTVTYNPNGGKEDPSNPMPPSDLQYEESGACSSDSKLRSVHYTVNATIKDYYTRPGYKFVGWNTSETEADNGNVEYADGAAVCNLVNPTKEKTIVMYAVWEPIHYTIVFDKNQPSNPNEDIDPTLSANLTGTMAAQTMTYDEYEKLNKNQYTFNNGQYTFNGWNTTADGSGRFFMDEAQDIFNLTTKENGTVTLYAQWTYNGYRIKFNANSGNGTMQDQVFYFGIEKELRANTFTKVGYLFDGWNTDFAGKGQDYSDKQKIKNIVYSSSENAAKRVQTLYAQWTPIQYTIHFNKNNSDATGTMVNVTATYDEPRNLPANQFKVPGAVFVGWSENPEGNGELYSDKSEFINLTAKDGDVIELYAIWDYIPVITGDDFYLVAIKPEGSSKVYVSTETLITGKDTYQYDKTDSDFPNLLKKTDSPMKAVDVEEGDISNKIVVEKITDKNGNPVSKIDQTVPGEYTVTYSATDSYGNKGSGTRKVIVLETPTPVINAGDRYFFVNSNITEKILLSRVTATDEYLGIISSRVKITGFDKFKEDSSLDDSHPFAKVGKYNVTYTVKNDWGGTASKTVTIYLVDSFDTEDRTGDIQYIRKSCNDGDMPDYCLEYLPEDSQWLEGTEKVDMLKNSLDQE